MISNSQLHYHYNYQYPSVLYVDFLGPLMVTHNMLMLMLLMTQRCCGLIHLPRSVDRSNSRCSSQICSADSHALHVAQLPKALERLTMLGCKPNSCGEFCHFFRELLFAAWCQDDVNMLDDVGQSLFAALLILSIWLYLLALCGKTSAARCSG